MEQLRLFQPLISDAQSTITRDALPTNLTSWKHPVHRWYNFIAGYSPEFVAHCISDAGLEHQDTVVDPFAGCATTLVVASHSGFRTIGYEPHPFFFKIASAKSQRDISEDHIREIGQIISDGFQGKQKTISDDARKFLTKLFPAGTLEQLLGARQNLETSRCANDPLAFLILSRLIDECSSSQTDGIYKAPTSRKRALAPSAAIARILTDISTDIASASSRNEALVYQQSSEQMHQIASDTAGLIITSPPYLNNFDFAEMTRMHLYFWGMADNWSDITNKVRSALIVNTTTALKGHKKNQNRYEKDIPNDVLEEIARLATDLSSLKKTKAGRKDYDLLLRPYMAQMITIYRECYRILRPGCAAHTMIADAAFYGIHVPSPQWLARALRWIGFSDVSCELVRRRGHRWILDKRAGSPIGLGEYHVIARK